MKIKSGRLQVWLGLLLLVLGFTLSQGYTWLTKPEADGLKAPSEDLKGEQQPVLNWLNEEGIIGERYQSVHNEEDFFTVDVFLPSLDQQVTMDISLIEYKILQDQDKVKIHYVVMDDAIKFIQFIRDVKGRLEIVDSRPIVVLDAGHGGYDTGDGGNEMWLEKDMNLQMVLKEKKLLENSGIRVVLTRDQDEFVSLFDRSSLSNYVQPALFLSNHVNNFDDKQSGIEVIYSLKSDEAFAQTIASGLTQFGLDIRKVYDKRDEVQPRRNYYFVHEYTQADSYIVEYGYADNEKDATIINDNWEEMAKTVTDTIKSYLLE